jgi:hypothetical protein
LPAAARGGHYVIPRNTAASTRKSGPGPGVAHPRIKHHFGARQARQPFAGFESKGPSLNNIPAGIASAPVRFVDLRDDTEHALRFAAGLFGVGQDADGMLVPEFGWAVLYDG